jgi:hypothetical protein
MPSAANHQWTVCRAWTTIVLALLLTGCKSRKQPAFEDKYGFRFVAPPGWVERARDDAMPSRTSHRHQDLPLPPLAMPGQSEERLLVRYDRLTMGAHAWLRVTVADLPSSTSLTAWVSAHRPGAAWEQVSEVESLEVSGLPAARIAFMGRWSNEEYICESIAVRPGQRIYVITGSFPASDSPAREQVRKAVSGASWQ